MNATIDIVFNVLILLLYVKSRQVIHNYENSETDLLNSDSQLDISAISEVHVADVSLIVHQPIEEINFLYEDQTKITNNYNDNNFYTED